MSQKTILVVDDTEENIDILVNMLTGYDIAVALDGEGALEIANSEEIDLILLDVMMPVMDGYEVCKRLKESEKTRDIPVIFLSAKIEIEDEIKGLELGAVDYISKPFSPPRVKERIKNHLLLKEAKDCLRDQNEYLEAEIRRRTKEIEATEDATISVMASLAETRDSDTGNHIVRTSEYVFLLSRYLSKNPKYSDKLDEKSLEMMYKSAPLHDIGKIGIPDHILLKPGKLEPDEFEKMKEHCKIGYDAIVTAEKKLKEIKVSFLSFAKQIALSHHEKWDGSGYPQGLKGEEIPLCARIMAVADVYDALISERVYKKGMPHEKAVEIIQKDSGTHFDPSVVEAFLALEKEFAAIAKEYSN